MYLCVAVHINYKSAIAENATHIGLNMKGNVLVHMLKGLETPGFSQGFTQQLRLTLRTQLLFFLLFAFLNLYFPKWPQDGCK